VQRGFVGGHGLGAAGARRRVRIIQAQALPLRVRALQRDGWDVAGRAGLGTQLSILGKGRHATRLVQGTLLANTWK
jgi:hypothetical protein